MPRTKAVPQTKTPELEAEDPFADFLPAAGTLVGEDGPEVVEPITAVTVTSPHVIVGMGQLASMSDEEFEQKLAILRKGRERIVQIQKTLMVEGEDYGKVKGIDRPFLQLPGSEKLEKFYGFATRMEVDRIVGQRARVKLPDGTETDTGEWISPPLAFHVKCFVHVGDFDGPIIAEGFGEANSWEDKYRWRWGKATCPKCGREGLIKGKADGKLQGKWWCPGREGGCNSTFEPGAVTPPGKVENTDPHSLAETLIQMAAKRGHVAAIRRATGTSGLFTQDPDSPSVRQQSEEKGGEETEAPAAVVTAGPKIDVAAGAKVVPPTDLQLRRLTTVSKERDIGAEAMAALIERLFGTPVSPPTQGNVVKAVKGMTGLQVGRLLMSMETGEVDEAPPVEATPGEPPQSSDEM